MRKLGKKREGAGVENPVYGVESQRIDVKILQPVQRVADKEMPHLVAVRPIEVQRRSPRRFVVIGEIRPVLAQVIAFRTQVVVDHVQSHSHSPFVRGIYQPLQILRRPVGVLNGKRVHPVVSPISVSWKLRDGHYFNGGHT